MNNYCFVFSIIFIFIYNKIVISGLIFFIFFIDYKKVIIPELYECSTYIEVLQTFTPQPEIVIQIYVKSTEILWKYL